MEIIHFFWKKELLVEEVCPCQRGLGCLSVVVCQLVLVKPAASKGQSIPSWANGNWGSKRTAGPFGRIGVVWVTGPLSRSTTSRKPKSHPPMHPPTGSLIQALVLQVEIWPVLTWRMISGGHSSQVGTTAVSIRRGGAWIRAVICALFHILAIVSQSGTGL